MEPDDSHDLDLVTVFRTAGTFSDMEALQVKALLESNGLDVVHFGDSRYPNFPDEIRVPRDQAVQAQQLIQEALAAGSSGAEEAEASGEQS